MYKTSPKREQELILQNLGIKFGEEEFRTVLKSKTNDTKIFEFIITKFGAIIFNQKRMVLIEQWSDWNELCFEFEEEMIKKERNRLRKSYLIKCFEACFFPNFKESLYLEFNFKSREARLLLMSNNGDLLVIDHFMIEF